MKRTDRARKQQRAIDRAVADAQRDDPRVVRPDSDGGSADWPKRTDDRFDAILKRTQRAE